MTLSLHPWLLVFALGALVVAPSVGQAKSADALLLEWLAVRSDSNEQPIKLSEYRQLVKSMVTMPVLDEVGMQTFTDTAVTPLEQKQLAAFLAQWRTAYTSGSPARRVLPWLLRLEKGGQADLLVAYSLVEAWGTEPVVAGNGAEAAAACKRCVASLGTLLAAASESGAKAAAIATLRDAQGWLPPLASFSSEVEAATWLRERLSAWRKRFDDGQAVARDQLVVDRLQQLRAELRAAADKDDLERLRSITKLVDKACPKSAVERCSEATVNAAQAMIRYERELTDFTEKSRVRATAQKAVDKFRAAIKERQDQRQDLLDKARTNRAKARTDAKNREGLLNQAATQEREAATLQSRIKLIQQQDLSPAEAALGKIGDLRRPSVPD